MQHLREVSFILLYPFAFIWNLFWKAVPDESKRLCVLASLYAQLVGGDVEDPDLLKRINDEFKLAEDLDVLKFPVLIRGLIWRNALTSAYMNRANMDTMANQIAQRTPDWLQYSTNQERTEDIKRVIDFYFRSKPQHV